MNPNSHIALLHGPDQPGLVAKISNWIYQRGGNILHADQHRDDEEAVFFQRIEWLADRTAGDQRTMEREFADFSASLGMNLRLAIPGTRPRVMIFVTKVEHCLHELLLRWRAGEYPCEMAGVISNHRDLESVVRGYGLPFHHIPVTASTKTQDEKRQIELLKSEHIDLVVLARYMQVLSEEFLAATSASVINIHHSFLPAFAGGRPYHQAHERGVKLIGATAHYATAVLDDGPIIHQDVVRVNHRHDVPDLVLMGRDLEKLVLAHAMRMHLNHRVLVYGRKTVVFD